MIELDRIREGNAVFVGEGQKSFGAVRSIATRPEFALVIYIEGAGDFVVGAHAIKAVHDGKVVVDPAKMDKGIRDAIAHAHDREDPNV